jgi:hypothetical protein
MKRQALAMICLATIWVAALPAGPAAQPGDLRSMFPELRGWTKDGVVETFRPENLYEHIDGAAENFLAYGFQQLDVQNYVDRQKHALSAEIYFHGNADNAFGIYGSERPLAGDYLRIGSQGYYEEGVLNFISDTYYVKLNGFDLGANGREVLMELAVRIAAAINGANALPELLNAFPAQGKIAHSERFIADHFLGHDFLRSAFVADYELPGGKFQLFIMKAASENEARAMLRSYAALDKARPAAVIQPGAMIIQDPYNGRVQLEWRGIYIWGVIGGTATAGEYLETIARNLAKR